MAGWNRNVRDGLLELLPNSLECYYSSSARATSSHALVTNSGDLGDAIGLKLVEFSERVWVLRVF